MDMGIKRKDKVYKRHHTKKFGSNRGGQSGQGQSDTDRKKYIKTGRRIGMDGDRQGRTDKEADSDGQKWTKVVKDVQGRTGMEDGQIVRRGIIKDRQRTILRTGIVRGMVRDGQSLKATDRYRQR
jgi:hypothetical protein